MPGRSRQIVRYLTMSDGMRLAWAEAGTGPTLVRAATWLTHLEYDLDSPVWQHWIDFFAGHFRFVRYDERGSGMSTWDVSDLSFDRRVRDLEAVVDAARPPAPIVLFGISHGAAMSIAYAIRHPERVSHLILCGGYARGAMQRDTDETLRLFEAIVELTRLWGSDNPAFRQVFTSRFIPGGTDEQLRWFNELCRKSASPTLAGTLLRARADLDVVSLLSQVRAPTLVLHARRDAVAPIAEGRLIASEIPGAEFVELDSGNHVLLAHEPAWARFQEAVLEFVGLKRDPAPDSAFDALSRREREILALVADGLSNAQIAERVGISEKTVRNHLSHLFDKLGVWSRAQAIVFARERGFTA